MARPLLSAALALASLGTLSCAAPRPPVDEVLAIGVGVELDPDLGHLSSLAERLLLEADRKARELRDSALEPSADAAILVAASRALFIAADLRMQRVIFEELERDPPASVGELFDIEERIPSDVRGEILSLCAEGESLASRALELDDGVAPRHYYAVNLGLVAWSMGPVRAVLRGLGGRISRAIDAAVEADPEFRGGAPLRLRGRFLDVAPWPYGDREQARKDLDRATELAPIPLHFLYVGDAAFKAGEVDAALAAWQRAIEAEPDEWTAPTAPFDRELARRRILAVWD